MQKGMIPCEKILILENKIFHFEALFSGKTGLKHFQVQLKLTIYWLDTIKR